MASGMLVITGYEELDRKLRELTPTLNRKYGGKAVREALKEDQKDFERICPQRTGAMRSATVIRRASGMPRGTIGFSLMITRKSLKAAEDKFARKQQKKRATKLGRKLGLNAADAYATVIEYEGEASGRKRNGKREGKGKTIEDHFAYYPIFIEIGTKFMRGLFPMTRVFEATRDRKRGILISWITKFVYDQAA
jgi:hypothetical protein